MSKFLIGLLIGFLAGLAAMRMMEEYVGSQEWLGFVYPIRENLFVEERAGRFWSEEACMRRAREIANLYRGIAEETSSTLYSDPQYECGRNCSLSTGGTIFVCEETVGTRRVSPETR